MISPWADPDGSCCGLCKEEKFQGKVVLTGQESITVKDQAIQNIGKSVLCGGGALFEDGFHTLLGKDHVVELVFKKTDPTST